MWLLSLSHNPQDFSVFACCPHVCHIILNFGKLAVSNYDIATIRDHLGLESNFWLTIASIDVVIGHQKTEVEGQIDLKICQYQ